MCTIKKRKLQIFKKIIILCAIVIVVSFFLFIRSADAENVLIEKNGLYAENIPDVIFQYAGERAEYFIEAALTGEIPFDENMEIDRNMVLKLCKPYVIWNDLEYQDAVYYFPIASEHKVIAIICIMGKSAHMEDLSASFPGDMAMVDTLNRLDYLHQDYIFYECQGLVFAEDKESRVQIDDISKYLADETKESSMAEEEFSALSYEEKVQAVLQKMEKFASTRPKNIPAASVFFALFLGIVGIGVAIAIYVKKHSVL